MNIESYRRRLRRASHPGLIGAVLAVLLLAAPAYAVGTIVARAKLANNSLALGGQKAVVWRTGNGIAMSAKHVVLPANGKLTPLLKVPFEDYNGYQNDSWMVADVNATNTGKSPVTMTLRIVINGKLMPGSFTDTWAPGTTQTLTALFAFCKTCGAGLHSGENPITLEALVSGSGQLTTLTTSLLAYRVSY